MSVWVITFDLLLLLLLGRCGGDRLGRDYGRDRAVKVLTLPVPDPDLTPI